MFGRGGNGDVGITRDTRTPADWIVYPYIHPPTGWIVPTGSVHTSRENAIALRDQLNFAVKKYVDEQRRQELAEEK